MLTFDTLPLHPTSVSGASHATENAPNPLAPRIVWRSAKAVPGVTFRPRSSKRSSLRLVTPADAQRIVRREAIRARKRARMVEGVYVAAALGTAIAIFWSAH